jgi:AcrR family transcriptional regulator
LAASETRVLRADATRNCSQLLEVATRVFVSADTEPSMRAIAREAGVGIATLYRHFPTRESFVDAVYRDQVARLTDGAPELLARPESRVPAPRTLGGRGPRSLCLRKSGPVPATGEPGPRHATLPNITTHDTSR